MKRLVCLRVLIALLVVSFLSVSSVYAQANSQKLDINKATVSELVTVKGIGEVKAKAIVDFVKKNAIKDMNELLAVKGVGQKVLEVLKQKFEVKLKK
ncbi:MAG: helix-hairpin-helix domain-containing protein [Candidatus Desulfofervidus sp.]|nr:helix-hairpin-helix domain-containing protein [Candidatus Desulfofervidus sp.]